MDATQLIEDLKSDEGWVPFAYKDNLGYLTIGYGFLIDEQKGGRLPKEIGEAWLKYEAQNKWDEVVNKEPWLADQPEDVQRAVANMAYNLGVSGVLGFKKMLLSLKNNNRTEAAEHALDSRWAMQVGLRAKRVSDLICGKAL